MSHGRLKKFVTLILYIVSSNSTKLQVNLFKSGEVRVIYCIIMPPVVMANTILSQHTDVWVPVPIALFLCTDTKVSNFEIFTGGGVQMDFDSLTIGEHGTYYVYYQVGNRG